MPDKFVVPQFLDNEDKILGPITVRQFLILMAATFFIFIEYAFFKHNLLAFIVAVIVTVAPASVFAFLKINGQPFHIFFVNFLQTSMRPALRIWHRSQTDAELRVLISVKPPPPEPPKVMKPRPESTRLRDVALTVNTGGVYNAEEE